MEVGGYGSSHDIRGGDRSSGEVTAMVVAVVITAESNRGGGIGSSRGGSDGSDRSGSGGSNNDGGDGSNCNRGGRNGLDGDGGNGSIVAVGGSIEIDTSAADTVAVATMPTGSASSPSGSGGRRRWERQISCRCMIRWAAKERGKDALPAARKMSCR